MTGSRAVLWMLIAGAVATGCASPSAKWTNSKLSGAAAESQFAKDDSNCTLRAAEELEAQKAAATTAYQTTYLEHKGQDVKEAAYKDCMTKLGWSR